MVREYKKTASIVPAGDTALVVDFGDRIDEATNDAVQAFGAALEVAAISAVREVVPTYRSLLVTYDPMITGFHELERQLKELLRQDAHASGAVRTKKIWQIPCCYGGACGQDLHGLTTLTGLSEKEIVEIHSAAVYKIYMLGFLPGFVYLGGLDPRIAAPRLEVPRKAIPEGSVGIGGSQTGVYPIASPGGWRLIGTTPVKFYDPDRENPILCRAGEYIRFVPVEEAQYQEIAAKVKEGKYEVSFKTE